MLVNFKGEDMIRRSIACTKQNCGLPSALLLGILGVFPPVRADEVQDCERLFGRGQFEECLAKSNEALTAGRFGESFPIWQCRSLMALGRYSEAREAIEQHLPRQSSSIRLRMLAYDVLRRNGEVDRARAMLREINALVSRQSWRYTDPVDQVALGRAALLLGADPRQVLEVFYDRAKTAKPDLRETYLAAGELALAKHDYAIAAQSFAEGLKRNAEDADLHFGLARAFAPSDPEQTAKSLAEALRINPRHVPAMLFEADHLIDAEQYVAAAKRLDDVLATDHWNAEAWAYHAVLAHLAGDDAAEAVFRSMALRFWKANPEVDHLIGRKLSQKYRFAEGAAAQTRALAFDADFLPAKVQLAQDLLRLGHEDEGWRLADEVQQKDRYDVSSYNLVTLHDNMSKFRTLRDGKFVVRMDPREAELYGDRVLALLRRASEALCKKYGLELTEPVTVEIFPRQNDFAVRTFGMPGGAGYLGVCFGKVITANSPASQADHPANWESVLWHEFCHVVTLQLTRNKMPRWLSEGISVYEERQADRSWGQSMTPQYREMILKDELVPISQLSGAFLSPPTPVHLQFAYYESSLVVEFIVDRFGPAAVRAILRDLSTNTAINRAIEQHTGQSMDELEREFAAHVRSLADNLAPQADLDRESLPRAGRGGTASLRDWAEQNPKNVWGQLRLAAALIEERKWQDAKEPLRRAIELFPEYDGADNAYVQLAAVHRELNETADERQSLGKVVELDDAATSSLQRLAELAAAENDWKMASQWSERHMAVNPLVPAPHRLLARAGEELGRPDQAIAAYRRLLVLEPDDPAEVHYRLARLLFDRGDPAAKRHVLMALEEAPRFPAALELLLKMNRQSSGDKQE
jgi:tetratricopeptide (TPR) repeat protein